MSITKIDGSSLLPKCTRRHTRFLYNFCLCKSFKEPIPLRLTGDLSRLAGAKVRTFRETTKLFWEKIKAFMQKICASWPISSKKSAYTLLYNIKNRVNTGKTITILLSKDCLKSGLTRDKQRRCHAKSRCWSWSKNPLICDKRFDIRTNYSTFAPY